MLLDMLCDSHAVWARKAPEVKVKGSIFLWLRAFLGPVIEVFDFIPFLYPMALLPLAVPEQPSLQR